MGRMEAQVYPEPPDLLWGGGGQGAGAGEGDLLSAATVPWLSSCFLQPMVGVGQGPSGSFYIQVSWGWWWLGSHPFCTCS